MKNILLLNAGTRNQLVQDFLNTINGQCKLIVTDSFSLAPSLYEVSTHFVTSKWDEEGYWGEIEKICEAEDVGLILSLVDPELELLAARRTLFNKKGIMVCTGTEEVIKRAFDKYETLNFVREKQYPWIKTYIDALSAKTALSSGEISFPLVVKPRKGSGSCGIEIVNDVEQLMETAKRRTDIVIQEYMDGQEIGVDVYVDLISGDIVSIFAKKKIKMRAGETDKSVSFLDQKLFDLVSRFSGEFGLSGVNDIDLFQRGGEYFISEVNPRFGGGYVHAYAAGVDFVQYLLNNMNGITNNICIGNYSADTYMMKYGSVKLMRKEEITWEKH